MSAERLALDANILFYIIDADAGFHEDEAEALRVRAFEEGRSESAIVREAVRRLLGIED